MTSSPTGERVSTGFCFKQRKELFNWSQRQEVEQRQTGSRKWSIRENLFRTNWMKQRLLLGFEAEAGLRQAASAGRHGNRAWLAPVANAHG